MPFCINCGKEVQEEWNICPFCSSPIQRQYSSVSDSVIVNDYNIHNSIEFKTDVNNHMLTLIDALKDGREDRAIEILEIAKKVDYELATEFYNVKYADEIAAYRVELLINEWSLTKEKFKTNFTDSLDVKLEKERGKPKAYKKIISKCYDLIQYNPQFVDSVEIFYEFWTMMPGYFLLDEYGDFRVTKENELGSVPHTFLINLFTAAGAKERADELRFSHEQKQLVADKKAENFALTMRIIGITSVLGLIWMILALSLLP